MPKQEDSIPRCTNIHGLNSRDESRAMTFVMEISNQLKYLLPCVSKGKGRMLLRYDANRQFFAYEVFKILLIVLHSHRI